VCSNRNHPIHLDKAAKKSLENAQQGFLLGNPSEIKNFRPKPCFAKNTQKKFSALSHVSKKQAKKVLHSDVFLKIKAAKSFRKSQKNSAKPKNFSARSKKFWPIRCFKNLSQNLFQD
jgi:hypothetical protein